MIVAIMTTALSGTAWAEEVTLASWTFTSESYPSNKTNFLATGGSCLESTFYLNGTGSTWNTNKGYAFTAVTDITITLKTTVALPAGTEISFSADTYYNKASNAPMTGFNLTASENGEAYSTTGLNIESLSLSNSSATKTCVYTLQSALAVGETVAIKYTQTGKAGAGQGYFGNIIITYTSGGTPTSSISADNVNIVYSATNGSIAYTLSNATGNVTASVTEGDWLTLGTITSSAVPFTCSENPGKTARTATVTLSYTDASDKVVTVTQAGNPNVVDNISDITATGTYTVKGTIVAISNRGFVLGDGTGYVYYYEGSGFTPADYSIGDIKKLSGSVTVYGGVFQFGSSTTITAATESNYVAEEPTVLTGSQMDTRVASTTPAQLSTYVQYEGVLSVSGTYYNITSIDGASTAIGSISYPISTDFTSLSGKTVKVTGYYVGISTSTYYNTMLESIEENTDPVITASDVNIAYDATSGEIEYSIINPDGVSSLTATSSTDWISDITVTATKVTFTTTANDGAEREGTITLSYPGAENKVVTVTQAEKVVTLTYKLTTSITSGKHYIISDGTSKALAGQNSNNRAATDITIPLGTQSTTFSNDGDVCELVIYGPDADGYYTIYDENLKQYLYAASDGSNYLRSQDGIDDEARWSITFGAENKAIIKAQGNNSHNWLRYNSSSKIFSCYASGQSDIYLMEKQSESAPEESVKVGSAGYTTYVTQNPVSFPTGVIGYVVTEVGETSMHLEAVTDAPAREPLVIKADAAGTYTLGKDFGKDVSNGYSSVCTGETKNLLKASDGNVSGGETIFALALREENVGFFPVSSSIKVPAGKAYLEVAGGSVKGFIFDFGATGIAEPKAESTNAPIYNLAGQRVSRVEKGIYIQNGRKFFVK